MVLESASEVCGCCRASTLLRFISPLSITIQLMMIDVVHSRKTLDRNPLGDVMLIYQATVVTLTALLKYFFFLYMPSHL